MIEVPDLFLSWSFWYVVGGAVVVVAAVLLIAVLLLARGIAHHAERALTAVRRIERNTASIWGLADALETLEEIRDTGLRVAEKTDALAGLLHGEPGGARTER